MLKTLIAVLAAVAIATVPALADTTDNHRPQPGFMFQIKYGETVACKSLENGIEASRLTDRLLSDAGLHNRSELELLDSWNVMRAFVAQRRDDCQMIPAKTPLEVVKKHSNALVCVVRIASTPDHARLEDQCWWIQWS